ncbi:hypothetical protein GH714_012867 [Hevea brasiliensis]|uniref:HAT C-terminal dimerisation domain-containing protein n=1 Tax=Hevea brasiliensis TaxID=3981 RepID=A0A6A6LHA9_HEVBR|nr:hypothetical protein GH714_012867 [Hevea brasiliensis]
MATSKYWTLSAYAKESKMRRFVEDVLDSSFWKECALSMQITKPFSVLRMVDSDDRTSMGYLYEAIHKAREEKVWGFQKRKKRIAPYIQIIKTRLDTQLHKNLHATGYWLNPCYQYNSTKMSKHRLTISRLLDVIETYGHGNPILVTDLTNEMRVFRNAEGDFGCMSATNNHTIMPPDEWWLCDGSSAPNLQKLAIRVLSQTCSASGCERSWSIFEQIHSKVRNRLEHQRLNDLVYVHYNLRLQQRCGSKFLQKDDSVMLLRNSVTNHNLAKIFLLSNIAFDDVEAPYFVDFVKSVPGYDHSYELPSSRELQMKFVPEIEMQAQKYVKDVKKSWEKTGCTIMVENGCNLINILIYSQKGLYLKLHMKFQAQEIHSFLKVIFDEIAWVRQIIDHAELIFRHMYSNAIVLSLMKQYTKGKELKHPCMSKFASKYQMLQSIFDNKNELQQLIMSDEWYMLDSNNNETARKVTDIIQGANFWNQGHDVLDVLEPIVQVLRLVENDRPNSGYLYGALKRAREAIEAFLNPTYMFLEDSECWGIDTYNGMNFVSENLVASGEEKAKFIQELQLYRKRSLKELTNEISRAIMTSSHPCEWWDYNRPPSSIEQVCNTNSEPTL